MGARRGYAAVDVLVTGLTLAVLAALLVVTGKQSRGNAQQAGSMANLHEFAAVTASYGADYNDQYWSFTWRGADRGVSQYQDINDAMGAGATFVTASAAQAVDLARRRGLHDFPVSRVNGWLPSVRHAHWVLSDYLDQPLTLRFAVSPGDRDLLTWSNDPEGFAAGLYTPGTYHLNESNLASPYRMSYRMGMAFFSGDYYSAGGPATIVQGNELNAFTYTQGTTNHGLGGRRSTEVVYPSQKVFMFDRAQWAGAGAPRIWASDDARVPMLFADGSCGVRVSGKANGGFHPGNPTFLFPYQFSYSPDLFEPGPGGTFRAKYLYTRGGLRGRDYDGTEPSGPPF